MFPVETRQPKKPKAACTYLYISVPDNLNVCCERKQLHCSIDLGHLCNTTDV